MIKVGVQAALPDYLLRSLPAEAEVVRIPEKITSPIELDFWVLPFGSATAKAMAPHIQGYKVAQTITAGVDSILPWLPKGVTLCDGRGIHDVSVSEWVVGVVLATYKRLPLYRDLQTVQVWKGQAQEAVFTDDDAVSNGLYRILGEDLHGRTVLIVGYGSIGIAIEERLRPFGVKFLRLARTPKQSPEVRAIGDLHELLPQADVIVVIVPLTDETRGFIGEREFALMKEGALLVNAARGPVVQTDALVKALTHHHLRAALDVTDPEPLPAGHLLWSVPNLLLTPHVAGSTPQFVERAFAFVGEQVRREVNNQPLENIVTEAGY
ncbi:2-hydroxyacid dehydrogenase [Terriglobus saanensis]|uniref:D-isomer specific 2-hydroxyacid dehydrogenase NAD-binding protein n=1 Tax=Terriglobus saanensis (strain ATCC BAA-1853 / DSM 23119 / SP1PR4) TaxID=401053 RepID=E8V3X3_TERSS|nr:2-hydroxyacid dehydrogenase [Terriglobus saanensis]ADV81387.1 D-isomer specific 2-hydroxyacid dehydrogenase NAD-binding protein [Terriglobus saanensis SP1PR4]